MLNQPCKSAPIARLLKLAGRGAIIFSLAISGYSSAAQSLDGSIELEHRQFFKRSEPGQIKGQTSAAVTVEWFQDWNDGNDRLEIEAFGRLDEADNERSHVDIRQFLWTHYGDNYEFSAGVGRVFWGVTETQHLVDIINQTDLVENIDGEDKLGQPMLRYQYFTEFGSFEAFILPYFRRRTFEGDEGRLNAGLRVATDDPVYEANDGSSNTDIALRYANSIGPIDLGLSWFNGTSREPDLFLNFNPLSRSTRPFYPQIDQFGIDVQLTQGGWLFKLEAIKRAYERESESAFLEDFVAATAGLEYTLVGLLGTPYDLGLLSEYSWDERGDQATTTFQNDLFLGARLVLNDIADSQFLLGVSQDMDYSGSQAIFLEGSTRINNRLSFNVEVRYFDADTPADPLFAFRDSSFMQLGLEFFFD